MLLSRPWPYSFGENFVLLLLPVAAVAVAAPFGAESVAEGNADDEEATAFSVAFAVAFAFAFVRRAFTGTSPFGRFPARF